ACNSALLTVGHAAASALKIAAPPQGHPPSGVIVQNATAPVTCPRGTLSGRSVVDRLDGRVTSPQGRRGAPLTRACAWLQGVSPARGTRCPHRTGRSSRSSGGAGATKIIRAGGDALRARAMPVGHRAHLTFHPTRLRHGRGREPTATRPAAGGRRCPA